MLIVFGCREEKLDEYIEEMAEIIISKREVRKHKERFLTRDDFTKTSGISHNEERQVTKESHIELSRTSTRCKVNEKPLKLFKKYPV